MNDTRGALPDFDQLWDYEDPAETEAQFLQLLPQAESSGDLAYHAELLTQLARTQGLQRQFEAAHDILDQVKAMLPRAGDRAHVRYLLERGRTLNSSGQKDQARPLFFQAWDLAREAGEDFYAVDAAHMLAIVEQGEVALNWNTKARDFAEASDQPRARNWLGSLYNNIGWTYYDMGDYETALEMFAKALQARLEQGDEQLIRIARWCLAKAQRVLGRPKEALKTQRVLLAEYEVLGEEPGYTYEELAENLWALDRADEARPFFAKAYTLLSQDPWLAEGEPERLARLKELGGLAE